MSKIRGKSTAPELIVRKILFAAGFRYRLNVRRMAGQPDIVLRKYQAVIFVHGCFWHGHQCRIGKLPVDNKTYWLTKMERNRERDKKNLKRLLDAGWRVLTIWECGLIGKAKLDSSVLAEELAKWILSEKLVGQIPPV